MSERNFTLVMFGLLLLLVGVLLILDRAREKQLLTFRSELDNLHGRLNGVAPPPRIPRDPHIGAILSARSNRLLDVMGRLQTR